MSSLKLKVITSGLLLIGILILGINYDRTDKEILENSYFEKFENSNTLSLMYETAEGSGEYVISNESTWPSAGYIFNKILSKCENGSNLIWNDTTKTVMFKGNVSDKCYVYFDKVPEIVNFASYIKGLHTTDGENDIYLHDGAGTYGTYEAGDNSVRYSGADPNNYVCFGSDVDPCPIEDLYRIIGVFDDRVKLIKADYATPDQLGEGAYFIDIYDGFNGNLGNFEYYKGSIYDAGIYSFNNYDSPTMRDIRDENLYTEYPKYLSLGEKNWLEYITLIPTFVDYITWSYIAETVGVKNIYDAEKENILEHCSSAIGLMYVSDYMYAADPTKENSWSTLKDFRAVTDFNWMYMGLPEMTFDYGLDNDSNTIVFSIDDLGSISNNMISDSGGVRPVFALKPNVELVDGEGTNNKPYRLDYTPSLITFNINSTSYQAEDWMTWAEWINSSYNIDGYIESISVYSSEGHRLYINTEENTEVLDNDRIINNHSYYHATGGLGEPIAPSGCY